MLRGGKEGRFTGRDRDFTEEIHSCFINNMYAFVHISTLFYHGLDGVDVDGNTVVLLLLRSGESEQQKTIPSKRSRRKLTNS